MDPIDVGIYADNTGLQTGMEVYWNLLLTRNIIGTPGIHLQYNPPLNQDVFVAIPHIKFRIAI